MAREKGTFDFSASFELKKKGMIDGRMYCPSYADLLTFTSDDYITNGFPVAVFDTDATKVAIYQCINENDLSNAASWKKTGGSVDLSAYDTSTQVTNKVTAEATARAAADTALQTNITTNTTNITANATAITAEATARTTGDATTLTSAKSYADGLVLSAIKAAGDWDASAGTYPTTGTGTSGAILRGDMYNVIVGGTIGGIYRDIGDAFYANRNAPGQTAAYWSRFESNTEQATETVRGTVALATSAEAVAATNDTKALTPLKGLALVVDQKKNYTQNISVTRGTAYANMLPFYYKNAGVISAINLTGVTNLTYATTAGGTQGAITLPLSVTAGQTLFYQFDFSNVNNLFGNLFITAKDN